jgi:hypothetical protein
MINSSSSQRTTPMMKKEGKKSLKSLNNGIELRLKINSQKEPMNWPKK